MPEPRKQTLPRKADLQRRYTVETVVYWRVWDALAQEYIDSAPGFDAEEWAQQHADAMEATR